MQNYSGKFGLKKVEVNLGAKDDGIYCCNKQGCQNI